MLLRSEKSKPYEQLDRGTLIPDRGKNEDNVPKKMGSWNVKGLKMKLV